MADRYEQSRSERRTADIALISVIGMAFALAGGAMLLLQREVLPSWSAVGALWIGALLWLLPASLMVRALSRIPRRSVRVPLAMLTLSALGVVANSLGAWITGVDPRHYAEQGLWLGAWFAVLMSWRNVPHSTPPAV
jgi:hypothetical protein